MEDITEADNTHRKRVCKDFEIKNMSLILLNFVSSWISMASSIKKDKRKINLLIDIDMFLMVKNVLEEEYATFFYRYAKANNSYMKDYDKNNEPSYLQFCYANNLCGWAMSLKLPVNNFKLIKDTS